MQKVVVVYSFNPNPGNLNMRQLLNPLFYDGAWTSSKHHPDSKRQRKARQRAKDLRAARSLKAEYVPLAEVDRTVYLPECQAASWRSRAIEIRPGWSSYRRKVRETCDEVMEGDLLRRAS